MIDEVDLVGACDKAAMSFGWTDGSDDTDAKLVLQHGDVDNGASPPTTEADGDAVGVVKDDTTGIQDYEILLTPTAGSGPDAKQATAAVMTPRFHCSIPELDTAPTLPGA